MKNRFLSLALAMTLAASLALPASAEDDEAELQESAGAPPAVFDVYIEVGDRDPMLFTSYTGTQMRRIAVSHNSGKTKLKYSSMSYAGAAGRVVTEYITLDDFLEEVEQNAGTLSFGSGDYWIMGEDFTQDPEYSGYSKNQLMFNWFSYDDILGTERYYYPNWDELDDSDAAAVPTVIGLKSYGDSSGMSDELLDMYTGSADYLWAYVLYYGQTDVNQITYSTFYRQQEQAIIRYDEDNAANETVLGLLADKIAEAEALLDETVVGTSSSSVAQGRFWVTQKVYSSLEAKVADAKNVSDDATNGEAYDAVLALESECESFTAARQSGKKSGFFWYTDNDSDTYIISDVQQLIELGQIVSGTAVDSSTQEGLAQDSFEGKTIVLGCDIDAGGARVNIGNSDYSFDGTFDGKGFEIKNLSATYTGGGCRGLFGSVGTSGVIKDFTLSGSVGVKNQVEYVGGVAGKNAGRIENVRCTVNVSAPKSSLVGGIAGENTGSISNCLYAGTVTASDACGAAAGQNSGRVTGCLVSSETPAVGKNASGGEISGCIASQASLAGENSGSVESSYTLAASPVLGSASEGSMENVFFIGSGLYDGASGLSNISELCGADKLSGLNASGSFVAAEGGLPCLDWQRIYTVYFELLLDGNTMEPVQAGEYLPAVRPNDPTAMKYSDGKLVSDTDRIFAGWYSDSERGTSYGFDEAVQADTTLYAAWTSSDGKNVGMLRINLIRVSESGEKVTTETYFHAEGETYSHAAESYDGYAGSADTVRGVMGEHDITVNIYYYKFGDVNRDGRVNSVDAMLVLRSAAGLKVLDDQQTRLADTDENGAVNSDDALLILRYSVGKIDAI